MAVVVLSIRQTNVVVYTLEQCFAKWTCDRLTENNDCGKKKMKFRWSSFWSWLVCKQVKLSHLGHRKPNWANFLWKWAKRGRYSQMTIVIGLCWTNFSSQKLKRRILATFGFNRTALRATQPKLHSMFCALFLKIALWAAELMSFGHFRTAIWHRWTIICGVPSEISVTPTTQRQLML